MGQDMRFWQEEEERKAVYELRKEVIGLRAESEELHRLRCRVLSIDPLSNYAVAELEKLQRELMARTTHDVSVHVRHGNVGTDEPVEWLARGCDERMRGRQVTRQAPWHYLVSEEIHAELDEVANDIRRVIGDGNYLGDWGLAVITIWTARQMAAQRHSAEGKK
jgi:hypothetical protein